MQPGSFRAVFLVVDQYAKNPPEKMKFMLDKFGRMLYYIQVSASKTFGEVA